MVRVVRHYRSSTWIDRYALVPNCRVETTRTGRCRTTERSICVFDGSAADSSVPRPHPLLAASIVTALGGGARTRSGAGFGRTDPTMEGASDEAKTLESGRG